MADNAVLVSHRLDRDVMRNGEWVRSYTITVETNVRHRYNTLSGFRYTKMLERCKEGGREQRLHPSYVGTTNGFRDFQEFVEWSMAEYGYNVREPYKDKERYYNLEKDILSSGAKVYSPDTCLFVPITINNFLCLKGADRGKYPIGCWFNKRSNAFESGCTMGTGRQEFLGFYDNPMDAHAAWQKAKVAHGRSLCDKYREHTKMVEGFSALLDKIEQDRLAGRESVFL